MNEVKLSGRVGKIDIQYKETGTVITQVSIGMPNGKTNSEGKKLYDNFWITFFNTKKGNTAEDIAETVKEGDYIRIEGSLKMDVFKPDGADKPKYTMKILGWGFCKIVYDEATKKYVDVKDEGAANEQPGNQQAEPPMCDDEEIPF